MCILFSLVRFRVAHFYCQLNLSNKLIGNPKDTSNQAPLEPNDALFLVDLSRDIGERNNIADDHPEIVTRLLAEKAEFER